MDYPGRLEQLTPNPTRGWMRCRLGDIGDRTKDQLLGRLCTAAARHGREVSPDQLDAWSSQLDVMQEVSRKLARGRPYADNWAVIFEYTIPRRGRRIDVVVLAEGCVVAVEFKVGSTRFDRHALWQAEDYALDLRDFHLATRGRHVRPVLVATDYTGRPFEAEGDELRVMCCGPQDLFHAFDDLPNAQAIDGDVWDASAYSPTPGIVSATRHLFASHGVDALSRNSADNLTETVTCVQRTIARAKRDRMRVVVFVTGVPGAGKTLVGIAASAAVSGGDDVRAAYMSGNGPLVTVLREAVARDAKECHGSLRQARRYAATLIQNVHEFTKLYGVERPDLAPDEHVVVFDEAQRAWHADKLAKRYPGVTLSEPALMLSAMSRLPEWSVLVALIGSGQEIHDGEAGIGEWIRAIATSVVPWHVVGSAEVASQLQTTVNDTGTAVNTPEIEEESACHLAVSTRSPRAQKISDWVDSLLRFDLESAQAALREMRGFRIAFTRDLATARDWLRDAARGEMRSGLLASSSAARLRADGIEMSPEFLNAYPLERWYLDGADDYRSSCSLEVAMSEFKIQGLEIDYAGMCWSGDLVPQTDSCRWDPRRLVGSAWRTVHAPEKRTYALNKYRVLLTRAREGMIIWVPRGSTLDKTRDPGELDAVADVLSLVGLREIT